MRTGPIRVLVVDDSRTTQLILKRILSSADDIEVVGLAANGREALEMIPRLDPTVICTDLLMPVMDGFVLTEEVMRRYPRPILVISSLIGDNNASENFRALEAGAVDVFAKPSIGAQLEEMSRELIRNIRIVAGVRVITRRNLPGSRPGADRVAGSSASPSPPGDTTPLPRDSGFRRPSPDGSGLVERPASRPADSGGSLAGRPLREPTVIRGTEPVRPRREPLPSLPALRGPVPPGRLPVRMATIGASTGGPQALQTILGAMPVTFPVPILCVQHISEGFLKGMVEWLDQQCSLKVRIAQTGELPLPGHVYFPQEDTHLVVDRAGRLMPSFEGPLDGHRPAVTTTFRSVSRQYGAAALAVLLTGMGRDGAEGMVEIHRAGGFTIAQDEATSVVWGMPREAILRGAVRLTLPVQAIAGTMVQLATSR